MKPHKLATSRSQMGSMMWITHPKNMVLLSVFGTKKDDKIDIQMK
jgi:hypothetical protein